MSLVDLVEEGIRKFGEYEACYFEENWYINGELTVKLG